MQRVIESSSPSAAVSVSSPKSMSRLPAREPLLITEWASSSLSGNFVRKNHISNKIQLDSKYVSWHTGRLINVGIGRVHWFRLLIGYIVACRSSNSFLVAFL